MLVSGTLLLALSAAVALAQWAPQWFEFAFPPVVAASMAAVLVCWAKARKAARRAEIVRSFAGLIVMRDGHAVRIDRQPVRGEWRMRFDAVKQAMLLGGWVVVVEAYGRYWVLTGSDARARPTPVTFRNTAVSEIVPAIHAANRMQTA